MKINKIILLVLMLLTVFTAISCEEEGIVVNNVIDYQNNKVETNSQFDFPGNYIAPELKIDGKMDEEEWKDASEPLEFGINRPASVVIYRGERALFCFFTVKDPDIQTVGDNNGDDVTKGDSVEIYFDFKNDATRKPESDDIQINIGAHGKTRIFVGTNGEWGSWNGLLDYQVELDGTLNNNKDTDNGYSVELMIPYSEIGIDQDSVFGVTVGHVARGVDSTAEGLQYTWGGIDYDGNFIDPQSPQAYILLVGKKFYSRGNEPTGPIDIVGKVKDINGTPLSGATIKVAGIETTTNADGSYQVMDVEYENVGNIEVLKDGYQTYTYKIPKASLRNELGRVDLDFCLLKENENKTVKITGVVKNPVFGLMESVKVMNNGNSSFTNSNGEFELEVKVEYDLAITLTKVGYKESVAKINHKDLIGKNSYDLGVVSLYSPSSTATFAGTKGIQSVTVEIYRGYEGVNFVFKSAHAISNGSKVELFIDTAHSFSGRDYSDYRIDLDADGGVFIENYGNGTNNIPSKSGIVNNAYLSGTTYYMEVMIPYDFLGISVTDVIGISFGLYDGTIKDWDGWGFEDVYVAPEFSDQYCRLGDDNVLYRASSNTTEVRRVTGMVIDQNNNPVPNAFVNGKKANEDGTFRVIVGEGDVTLSVTANGYNGQDITINSGEFVNGIATKTITLVKGVATISGTCNVEGAKVTLESDPSVFTYVVGGKYELQVPTTGNVKLVFTASGYQTATISVGKNSLVQSANLQKPIQKNVTMVSN